ncbi:MAG: undecaprenyl/decaprenyl-phosphate alpha-N-acetylglucosaminyl 1-phosphate transferase [Firmicutes bacterium]|nr:undecaprenyl/decaprenyl-phosphate alpha-N-acetylglucosaminyl 1-phosphate transferase [Bacillota bacterium]
MNQLLLMFLAAFAVSVICTPLAIKLAPKIGAVDVPKDARRVHTKPMPRFGGMAIFIGTMAVIMVFLEKDSQLWGVILSGTLMYLVGVVDDLKGIPAKVKLLGQIACATILYCFSIRITTMANLLPWGPGLIRFPVVISFLVTVVWIVGVTNAVNLIDGLDGLAAGVCCIASLSIAYTAHLHDRMTTCSIMSALAGACVGFLMFNFNPAKIFMGDSGSLFLGYMLASVSLLGDTPLKSTTVLATLVPICVLALPLFDTTFAILRRLVTHRPIMEADRGHLHHRIMAIGWGQRRTVLILYCISGVMGVAAILFSLDMYIETLALMIIAGTLIFVFLDNDIVDNSDQVTKGRKLLQEWPKKKNEIVKRKDGSIIVKDDKKGKGRK